MTVVEAFAILAICLAILLICREVTCWYFKLNNILEQLEQLNAKLGEFLKRLE